MVNARSSEWGAQVGLRLVAQRLHLARHSSRKGPGWRADGVAHRVVDDGAGVVAAKWMLMTGRLLDGGPLGRLAAAQQAHGDTRSSRKPKVVAQVAGR